MDTNECTITIIDDDKNKTLSINNFKLNNSEFSRLFDINIDILPSILKKIFIFGYNSYFPNIHETISTTNNIENQKLDQLDGLINKLTGISNNSKKIGIFGEHYIQELITKNFIGMTYQKTGEIDHSGDGLLTFNNGTEILIETKNYTNPVNDDEVIKFTNDMKTTKKKYGLFISINSKINKINIIDLKTFTYENQEYYQFYISCLNDDLHRLEVGILVLQLLSEHNNTKSKEITLNNNIKNKLNELIDQINQNEKLRGSFLDTEKEIRNTLHNFYLKLRDNHLDMENKIKNIFTYLEDSNVINLPKEIPESKLLELHKKSKIINNLKKILDYLHTHTIKYIDTDKEISINNIGTIKIFKEKIEFKTISKVTFIINDSTWELFEQQFNLIK
jgi:hypothetical protein